MFKSKATAQSLEAPQPTFQQKILKHIFLLSCVLALAYPLVHITLIFPSYQKLLVTFAEDDAVRVASHLVTGLPPGTGALSRRSLPADFAREMNTISEDFGIEKIKVFSADGEIIFSSDPEDIGKINTRDYFHQVVSKGHNFTKLVSENTKTLEGRLVASDVVETYVPVMHNGSFAGAFEIYYDITVRNQALKSTALRFSALPFGLTVFFLLLVTGIVLGSREEKAESARKLPAICRSPGCLLLFSGVTIFVAEAIVMALLSSLPGLSKPAIAILDATLLVMIVAPGIYFFFLQPLFVHMQEREKVEKKLEELSITDELTGLLNRRGFFVCAEKLSEAARRAQASVSVLYADLNDLKWINDHLGHVAGDEALKEAAAFLKKSFREADIVARMGGDEFAVCTLNIDGQDAAGAIDRRFGETLQEHRATRPEKNFDFALSWGIVSRQPRAAISVEELLKEADARMYAHKKKNRPDPNSLP